MTQLTYLRLSFNRLSGPIQSSLGNLNKLTYLSLGGNQLSGSIPSSFGGLTRLTYLNLGVNQLSGQISPSLGNLNQLTSLLVNNNSLTGFPSSLRQLVKCKTMALLPNPMSSIPYDIAVRNPVSTMSVQNLTNFLATPVFVKRESSSTVASLTTDQLLKMCPLNNVANQDILAGCVAGIVYFCQAQTDLTPCQRYYDTIFSRSIFEPIGANCPAWKSGPNSGNCIKAVETFSVSLEYTTVNKDFANFFARILFADQKYAPCNSIAQKCTW